MTAGRVNIVRVVLDTNVLLAGISRKSSFYWVWKLFLSGRCELCVTTDILAEYAEIIEQYFSQSTAEFILEQITLNKNTVPIVRYFEWNLVENDPDDNKFVDCAVAANADYIVTEDKHFNILKNISFPTVVVINTSKFEQVLGENAIL